MFELLFSAKHASDNRVYTNPNTPTLQYSNTPLGNMSRHSQMTLTPPKGRGFPRLDKGISFLVLGAGRFGRSAIEKILIKDPIAKITLVDIDRGALNDVNGSQIGRVVSDGIDHLDKSLSLEDLNHWVVPAIPVHVVFEWILRRLRKSFEVKRIPLPDGIELPNKIVGKRGDLYTSYADFICPDNCPEPEKICLTTGKKRGMPMFQRIRELESAFFVSRCIQSHQIAPGLGGYSVQRLKELLQEIKGVNGSILIGTACRCHGVVSGLQMGSPLPETKSFGSEK